MCQIRSLSLLLVSFIACSKGYSVGEEGFYLHPKVAPWFTGPLLTPSANVIKVGHANIEPYLYATKIFGSYDKNWHPRINPVKTWNINVQLPIQAGLIERFEVTINPQVFYNYNHNGSSIRFADLPIGIGYQLRKRGDIGETYWPAIKLIIAETFPTGKYQHLDGTKGAAVDSSGSGSYSTRFGTTLGQTYHLSGLHYLSPRFHASYIIHTPTHVKGFNTYGGAADTNATVIRRAFLNTTLGLEYSVTKNWALALDIASFYRGKRTFRGNPGHSATGVRLDLSAPSSNQISLAPAFEYNWSSQLGLITGAWFTVAGRNSSRFISSVTAFNYYY